MPMQILLSATLRKYVPGYDPAQGVAKTIARPMKLEGLCREMGIPPETVTIVMINGKRVSLDYEVQGDERVALFPPVGGG